MLNIVLFSFASAMLAPLIYRAAKHLAGILALFPLAVFVYFCTFLAPVSAGGVFESSSVWAPDLDIQLAFRLDGLSLLFALLISGIGTLIIFYAAGYMAGRAYVGRFMLLMLMFLSSMLGLVLADHLLTLFVFWELTSITSYLLIGFENDKEEARAAALQALLVTGGGGLAMLAGMILLGMAGGTYQISALLKLGDSLAGQATFVPALLLILLGAFSKSAQFPFHFWLPNAMSAPTPVSAYLHSATMVKAGVYLLARLYPIFNTSPWWQFIVTLAGLVTVLAGAVLAFRNSDLKRILAYTTVSALGTMTLLLGAGSDIAVKAALVFLLAHALYKGALFMLAGAIDHETGSRDVQQLGGLRKAMPLLAVLSGLAALSMAGFGPLLSFIGKELMFEAALAMPQGWREAVVVVTLINSAVSVALALVVFLKPFFGALRYPAQSHPPHDPPVTLWLGAAVLGLAGLVLGIFPALAGACLVQPAASAALNTTAQFKLSLWHGLNPALGLSAAALVLGGLLYLGWGAWQRMGRRFEPALRRGPEAAYNGLMALINRIAIFQTRMLQNGLLRFYLLIIIMASLSLIGLLMLLQGGLHWPERVTPIYFYEAALVVLIIIAVFAVIRSRSRLGAITAMGVVGYGVALIFLQYGAPDLAMTQFLIESITVVLFVFAFYHLPPFDPYGPRGPRLLHAAVGVVTGLVMTFLVLSAVQISLFPSISTYFMERAVSMAHGRNIVNVILVDFRGLDTLGEITVLAVAATGVYAVLKYRFRKEPRG